ncbi:hypothetical protein [Intestinibacter bartlettii]|uniref:Uncharacterized protein n=1 Tax=Intestinibacter bartlettii TaxID=261299 RepID=A0ABS6DZY1_9FIRM|nr:hypothetical protein [Intestinibacter bartlettii]MBU5337405.1 hypothetical protein [Intestinibacter bartlettii]MCC2705605.1 hypothetical protein [Intestinibacter bartlettii]MCC2761055.1 hypothetical protein [Intestinibacter bartlettii]MDU6472011.1 hypothetical protein [Intestinibacter bartlettii]
MDNYLTSDTVNLELNPADILDVILSTYKDVKNVQEIEDTKRYEVRQKAKAYIANIEATTKLNEISLKLTHEERMPLILKICDILSKDILDEYCLKVCQMLLNYLSQDEPLKLNFNNNLKYLK